MLNYETSSSVYEELQRAKSRIAALEAELARGAPVRGKSGVPDPDILLGIRDVVIALDHNLRLTWANAGAEQLMQQEWGRAAGHELREFLPAFLETGMEETCRSVLLEQKSTDTEFHCGALPAWYAARFCPTRNGGVAIFLRDISREKLLLADQSRQASVLEQVHDSIITTDLDGTITRWNHGAAAMFGYSAREAIGQHVSMLYFEEDRGSVFAMVLEPLLRAGQLEIELRNRRKSGEECYVRLSLSLLRDEFGQAYAMLGVAVDVTAQRQAEQALRRSEELYRCLVETVPQIVYIAGPDGETKMINSRWEEYSGVPTAQCLELNWLDWIHPDDVSGLVEGWKHSLITGEPFERLYRVRNAGGAYRWHLSRSRRVHGKDGADTEWVGVLTDIHDRKLAEDELRLSEERMRVAEEVAGFGHFELSLRTGEFIVTEPLRRLLHLTSTETVTFEQKLGRIHPDDRAGVEAAVEQIRKGLTTKASVSYRSMSPDGSVDWRILNARAFPDGEGGMSRLIGVIADITPHKAAADAFRLDAERKQLQDIFQSLTEAVVVLSADGKILSMNPAARRMHEIDPTGPLPADIDEVAASFATTHPDGSPFAADEWPAARTLRGEVFTGVELIVTNMRTGSSWTASYGGAPVRDEQGRVSMAVISIRDITAERAASAEIQQANRALHSLSGQLLRMQDDERRRIARELHDGTVQVLSAAIMNLHVLEDSALLEKHDAEKRIVTKTLSLAQQCARELRTMSYLLHPPALDELGFVPALLSWTDGFSERSGIAVGITMPPEVVRFSPEIERALFRITQEALGNVHRHSRCKTADITLEVREGSVCLEIMDDGVGFDTTAAAGVRAGVGLLGMRERLIQLGGSFSVSSRPGKTVVRAEVPTVVRH